MHHAILIKGQSLENDSIPEEVRSPGADISHFVFDTLPIDAVREVIASAHRKPVTLDKVYVVIKANKILDAAQQALLKILEEPPVNVQFYILLPNFDNILPTIMSRVQISDSTESDQNNEVFSDFVQMTYADRLSLVAEKVKNKDKQWVMSVVSGAQKLSRETVSTNPELSKIVVEVAQYIDGPGASNKMLLEAIAVNLPKKT